MIKTEIIHTLFHDKYETDYGDGFYPYYKNNDKKTLVPIDITFQLISNNTWKQIKDNYCIISLDNDDGKLLLENLNDIINNTSPIQILNYFDSIIYIKK